MRPSHVFHPTPLKCRDRISFRNQDGLNTTHTTTQPLSARWGGNMSSRNTMLLVFNRGAPGSYRSREHRGVISQKETRFWLCCKAHHIPGAWVSLFRTTEFARTHTRQDEPYPLTEAAKYYEYQAQRYWVSSEGAITALVVYAVCCCSSCWQKKQIRTCHSKRATWQCAHKLFRKL